MSIWDDPDFAAGSGEFIKFEKVGDSVTGTVKRVGRKVWEDGSVSPQLDLVTDDGEEKTLTAGQVRLKAALAEQRPEAGDSIYVALTDVQKRPGGKTLKIFDVRVKRGGGTPAAAPAAAAPAAAVPAPPF